VQKKLPVEHTTAHGGLGSPTNNALGHIRYQYNDYLDPASGRPHGGKIAIVNEIQSDIAAKNAELIRKEGYVRGINPMGAAEIRVLTNEAMDDVNKSAKRLFNYTADPANRNRLDVEKLRKETNDNQARLDALQAMKAKAGLLDENKTSFVPFAHGGKSDRENYGDFFIKQLIKEKKKIIKQPKEETVSKQSAEDYLLTLIKRCRDSARKRDKSVLTYEETTDRPFEWIIEDGVEKVVPIGPEEFEATSLGKKLDTARLNKDLTSLIAMNQGLQFTEIVLSMDKDVPIGSPGAVNQLLTRLGSLYRDWSPTASGDLPRSSADFDDGIKDMLFSSSQLGTGERTKEDNKAFNELMRDFNKDRVRIENEMNDIRKNQQNSKFLNENAKRQIANARPGADRQRIVEQLALLRLIENRMKYIVANANKGEDRLTVADVTDASKGTALLRFFKPSDEAAADYKAIAFQLNDSYTSLVKKYIRAGGNPAQVLEHKYSDFINNYKNKLRAKKSGENKEKNQELSVDDLINKIYGK